MEKIYFKKSYFVTDNNLSYDFDVGKDDRFYRYIMPYVSNGTVESAISAPIDKITIKDVEKTFFENNSFTLQARMMIERRSTNGSVISSHHITIAGVSLDVSNSIARLYKNGVWEISLGKLNIPYHTNITTNEIINEN